jgi:regulator of replication initiation timing
LKNKIARNQDDLEKQVRQFQDLFETWKQWLNSRMEENVLLKNKITEILKNNFDHNSLEEIEEFQTQFIVEDELIHSLRRDVNELDNFMYSKLAGTGKLEKSFNTKIENLRKDITNSVTSFRILKAAFDNFQNKIFSNLEN